MPCVERLAVPCGREGRCASVHVARGSTAARRQHSVAGRWLCLPAGEAADRGSCRQPACQEPAGTHELSFAMPSNRRLS
eukprot:359489-Chlamydomonas_euryale.AAC.2